MKLTTATDVLDSMQLQQSTPALTAVEEALDQATKTLEASIGTVFEYQTRTDFFTITKQQYRQIPYEGLLLRLKSGFVDEDDTFKVYIGTRMRAPATDGEEVDTDDYDVDYEKGTVLIYYPPQPGRDVLAVRYSSGLLKDSADKNLYRNVPEWLTNLATVKVVQSLNSLLLTHRRIDLRDEATETRLRASELLNPHIRPLMGYITPSRSILL